MKRLITILALLSFAGSLRAQTTVTIQNPSFESPGSVTNGYWGGTPTGWTISGNAGLYEPSQAPGQIAPVPDGLFAVYSNGGTASQVLSGAIAANANYTLGIFVGHRSDRATDQTWTLTLTLGNQAPCVATGSKNAIPSGQWGPVSVQCPSGASPSGNISVSFGSSGDQIDFDMVSLSFTPINPPISVSVAPATATIVSGQRGSFTATVTNDSANAGVNWTVTSGSVSPASGLSTTYTAPTLVPANNQVTLTATSVTDSTKSGTAIITIPHQAALTWQDSANPAGTVTYSVLRGQPTGGVCPAALSSAYTLLASGLTAQSYTDTTIAASTQYCYQVQAVANNQSGIAGIILFVPGSVSTITVSSLYPWWYNKLVQPQTTLTVKQVS